MRIRRVRQVYDRNQDKRYFIVHAEKMDEAADLHAFLRRYAEAVRVGDEAMLGSIYAKDAQISMRMGGRWTPGTVKSLIDTIVERPPAGDAGFRMHVEHAFQEGDIAQVRLVMAERLTLVSLLVCERIGGAWRIVSKAFYARDAD